MREREDHGLTNLSFFSLYVLFLPVQLLNLPNSMDLPPSGLQSVGPRWVVWILAIPALFHLKLVLSCRWSEEIKENSRRRSSKRVRKQDYAER